MEARAVGPRKFDGHLWGRRRCRGHRRIQDSAGPSSDARCCGAMGGGREESESQPTGHFPDESCTRPEHAGSGPSIAPGQVGLGRTNLDRAAVGQLGPHGGHAPSASVRNGATSRRSNQRNEPKSRNERDADEGVEATYESSMVTAHAGAIREVRDMADGV